MTKREKAISRHENLKNRLRAFLIPHELLVEIFNGRCKMVFPTQPKDVEISSVHLDLPHNCLRIFLCSEEYPKVALGEIVPVLENIEYKVINDATSEEASTY